MQDAEQRPKMSTHSTKPLGQMLVERGAITGEQLLRAIESQQAVGGRIGTCLLEMDVLTEETLLETLSDQLAVPAVPPAGLHDIDRQTLSLVTSKIAKKCRAVPFASSNGDVQVAILDVRDLATLDEIAFCTSKRVQPHIANEVRIFEALEKHYGQACPSRYVHLLDRLEGQVYAWQDGALISDGPQALSTSWTAAEVSSNEAPAAPSEPESDPQVRRSTFAVRAPIHTDDEGAADGAADLPPLPWPVNGRPSTAAADETIAAVEPAAPSQAADDLAGEPPIAEAQPAETQPVKAQLAETQPVAIQPDEPQPAAPQIPLTSEPLIAADLGRPPSPFNDIEHLLADQSDREVIGGILLRTLANAFGRCALFKIHRRRLRGWLSHGDDFDGQLFSELELSLEDSSIFRHLQQGSEIYIGPLPASPAHRRMACTWGGDLPKDCLMMPIRVKDHMVCVVYVDNGTEGLLQPDVDGLRRLVHRASKAFEWCILRKKSQQSYERGR